jgi:signal transduction histidine kinase
VIKGNVRSIRQFLEERESWPEELSQREDDVEFAVERVLALREELLAASRNESRELEIAPVQLHRALQRVTRWGRVAAQEKGLSLAESYEAANPYVIADEWGVQSIFSNLLSNAIRYTPVGGSIVIRTHDDDLGVAVEIADTGIGVSEQDQPRLFERFYRTEEAKKAVPFGIGLGLAITRDLVSAMGGSITLTSELGSGTTFKVTFLLAELDAETL